MTADPRIYDSERLATCYASTRPPVHDVICARLIAALPKTDQARTALDIGCGAGASTAALVALKLPTTGIDPYLAMLRQARQRLPSTSFIQAKAEALPAHTASVELVTAAGSLNYTDMDLSLAEISRVLTADGHLAIYDFSTGRALPMTSGSVSRFEHFERRFPWPQGYAMDLARLPYAKHGLSLRFSEQFVVEIEMPWNAYLDYIMGETNVEAAIVSGLSESAAREACQEIFQPLFTDGSTKVGFNAELTVAGKQTHSGISGSRHMATMER